MSGMTGTGPESRRDPGLFSIGHSNRQLEELVALLRRHRIEVVADVRTSPYSRYNPQFNLRDLRHALKESGLQHIFLGKELGGRPEGDRFYDSDGRVSYGQVARTEWFQAGLERLCDGGKRFRVAILCSEENPKDCHRFLLITAALRERGVEVSHIRGDGRVQSSEELGAFLPEHREDDLFGEGAKSSWRSARSVLRTSRQKIPSRS